ncbi:MAG: hypothetical protein KBB86_00950 [Candidatus Pacebacteria bacterium]|nr:hypothetical protein [Candidatus Paceibacterota bacterium]
MGNKIKQKIMVVVVLIAVALAGYFYYELYKLRQNPQAQAEQEVKDLTAKVGRLVVLPSNETPTIATVSDPEALKDQPFFAQAVKGDKVLIYAQSKKAYLYSVTLNKIIDVAPLNIGNQKSVTPPTTQTSDGSKNSGN